eukprot:TRINITY_DN15999_c0_g1_i1.p1 TRINITY_DN15999_c0_g1~~TRINITY_DN15999_c0_g1_i1.p1  ORF type:complete len:215 (-),score=60.07 TRINITY_DN15999_c0_g1_i1:84-728(-)
MEILQGHDEQYNFDVKKVQKKLSTLENLVGERKKQSIQDIQKDILGLDNILRKMEELIEKIGPNQCRQISNKMKTYYSDIKNIRRELQKGDNYNTLINDSSPTNVDIRQNEQRIQILEDTSLLDDSTQSIKRSYGLVKQTEEVGRHTLGELGRQREVLEGVGDNLDRIDDNMGKSRRILGNMARRVATNKCILLFIVLCELAAIGAILYLNWRT